MKMQPLGCGILLLAMTCLSTANAQTADSAQEASASRTQTEETGLAAVYSNKLRGHITASGKKYDPAKLTAAHKTLPFGTRIRVTNIRNGKSVELRVNDRGPRQVERVLDITPRAAHALGFSRYAMAQVKFKVIKLGGRRVTRHQRTVAPVDNDSGTP